MVWTIWVMATRDHRYSPCNDIKCFVEIVQSINRWHVGSPNLITHRDDSPEDPMDIIDRAEGRQSAVASYIRCSSYIFMTVCLHSYCMWTTVRQTLQDAEKLVSQKRPLWRREKNAVGIELFSLLSRFLVQERIFHLNPQETRNAFQIQKHKDITNPLIKDKHSVLSSNSKTLLRPATEIVQFKVATIKI